MEPEDRRFPVSPGFTRSRSQLTALVRQLSEDLNKLRNEGRALDDDDDDDPFEGLDSEQSRGPVSSMGGSSCSGDSSSVMGSAHLFLSTPPPLHPLDQPVVSGDNRDPSPSSLVSVSGWELSVEVEPDAWAPRIGGSG